MEENFEDNNANENLLSQSYLDSIQKVTGNDRASLLDFQIPDHLLEKRKKDWNALFEKYSSFLCEEQDEPEEEEPEQDVPEQYESEQDEPEEEEPEQEGPGEDELKHKEPEHEKEECTTKNNQRFPMRKPMSMVQYWVNTGNQPYATNNLDKSQSESGSSLAEECLEEVENMNSPCQINTSLEKNHETNETSRNMHLRLANSSGSSVDTVAYILANNNTTKKADTIAIMEGSKIVNKELSHHSEAINDKKKVNKSKKDVSFLDNILFNLRPKELDVNIANNINKNVKNINNVSKNLQNTSQNQENHSDDSDESIFKSKYDFHILSQNSIDQNNDIESVLPASIIENKTFRRKKLYNNTESPAEFTPVSEDNTSQLTFRLPKKCEHPALETPRISSRPSYLVRYQRLKLRTKRKSRISNSFKMLKSQKNGENNHLLNVLQCDSQTINEEEKINDQNLEKADNCSNDVQIREDCKRKSISLNKNLLNDFEEKALNVKSLVIPLQRLPYKYDSIEIRSVQEKHLDPSNLNKSNEKITSTKNNLQYSPSKKSCVLEAKSDNYNNLINGVSQNETDNDESDTIDFKSSVTKSDGFSSQIQKSYSKKSMNYIVAFSSDDEPELSVSILRQSTQKLLKETSQIKNSSDVNDCPENELVNSKSKDDNVNNKISTSESNKIKSERKKHDLKRKSDKMTVQSEKNIMTDANGKSSILESNNKSSSKCFAFSEQMDKMLSLMSSDEETIIFEPKDCSVPSKFLEKSKGNLSPGNKALKEKFDQTSSNTLSLNEKQKSSNEKKSKILESKSVSLKKSMAVKNFRYSRNTSSSSEEDLPFLQLPVKSNFSCKPKLTSSAVRDNSTKSSPTTEETVSNLIGDLSVNSVLLNNKQKKLSLLEERINKIKMKTQSTLLSSDNNHLKTSITQAGLQIDSSEEENVIGSKSSVKESFKKKTWLNKNKRSFEDHSEVSNNKSGNKKDREKSKKEYLSSKKPKRKIEMFMSSDEECVIPLKIKST